MLFGKHFRKYYIKYGLYFLAGIVVLAFINWYQLVIPANFGVIIDELKKPLTDIDVNVIHPLIIEIGVIAIGITFGRFLWRYTIFGASRRIEHDLRNKMFIHSTRLPQQYYSQAKVGGLMTYFINDLEAIRMAFGPGILMLFDGLMLGAFAIYRMSRLHARLTLYIGIPMLGMMFVAMVLMKRVRAKFKIRQQKFTELSDFTQENFSGISVIKAYVRELKEIMLFQNKSMEYYRENISFVRYTVLINITISVAVNLVVLLIIGYGSYVVVNGNLTAGELTTFMSYYFSLIWPTMAIAQFMGLQGQSQASAERINKFLEEDPIVQDKEDLVYVEDLKGAIEVKNLTFQYPDGDRPVLKNVSFKINQGEMVGVLGRTGSGKSSLVDLLLRIYNLEENQIFIDGHDIMSLPIKNVRSLMGYVPQDNFLFSDTISNNIGFAFETQDLEIIERSAKLADVYDNIVEFNDGFETVLGERGVTVSGGQKQRISIARAIAKNPEVLILDDSVSAVDTKTEEAIISNLHKIRKGKTTIFIAHRISTVKKMDKIILLDEGEVVAIGSHKTLMKESPLYQDMVKRQQLENLVQGGNGHEGL